jgi:hypothetical protein
MLARLQLDRYSTEFPIITPHRHNSPRHRTHHGATTKQKQSNTTIFLQPTLPANPACSVIILDYFPAS